MDNELKPLYKFTLNKEIGCVDVLEVTNYDLINTGLYSSPIKHYYRYRHNGLMYYVFLRDLDKFKNNHVYSFNPNKNSALMIMMDDIQRRMDNAYKEYDRWRYIKTMLIDKEVKSNAGILE